MQTIGKVMATFSAKKGQSGFPRPQVDALDLIYQYGIKEDKFAGKDEKKAVMIVGLIAYETAKQNGIELQSGSLGENILLDFNPQEYAIGTIFKIGSTVLQITQECTICNHLAVFGDNLPMLVKDCRGLYCKILEGGNIKANMQVQLLKELPTCKSIA